MVNIGVTHNKMQLNTLDSSDQVVIDTAKCKPNKGAQLRSLINVFFKVFNNIQFLEQ